MTQVVIIDARLTSRGDFPVGTVVDLPPAEAKNMIRHKWAQPAAEAIPAQVNTAGHQPPPPQIEEDLGGNERGPQGQPDKHGAKSDGKGKGK